MAERRDICFGGNVRKRLVWRKVQVSPSAEFLQSLLGPSAKGKKRDMIPQGKRRLLGLLQPRSDEQLMVLKCLRE